MLILVAAGIVHIVRHNVFDIAVFFGTAAFIVVDRLRGDPEPSSAEAGRLNRRQRVVAAATLALYSLLAGQWAVDTWPMRVAMIVPGVLFGILVAVSPPTRDRAAPAIRTGWIPWCAVLVAIALWELASFVQQPNPIDDSYQHPTISAIVEPWLGTWGGRAIFLLLWLAAGFWLLRVITAARATDAAAAREGREAQAVPGSTVSSKDVRTTPERSAAPGRAGCER